jgi:5-hydroxyisourate hydrolase-like protein (transthyretin family)
MNSKHILILSLLLLVYCFSPNRAAACSCGAEPSVLTSFERSEAVIVVKLVSIETLRELGPYTTYKSAKFAVEKIYKGNVENEINFSLEGVCAWSIYQPQIGERFLLYTDYDASLAMWSAFKCGRSRRIADADNDLLYLNNMSKVSGKTRISGTLDFRQSPAIETDKGIYRKLSGLNVKIIGATQTYELKTDVNGVYEIYDLPPGNYAVQPEVPSNMSVDASSVGFSIPPVERNKETGSLQFWLRLEDGKHEGYDFEYEFNNSVSGKLLDKKGRPMEGVCVHLIPAKGKEAFGFYEADCTNANGNFVITTIPSGDYLMVFNEDGEVSGREPFGAFFYPGVIERKKAEVLTFGEGGSRSGLTIRPPNEFETIIVSGRVTFADGVPVSGEPIRFSPDKSSKEQSIDQVLTNKDGYFSVRLLRGTMGNFRSSIDIYRNDVEHCLQLRELLEKKQKTSFEFETNSVQINGGQDIEQMKLVFPFKSCPKVEK